MMVIELHSLPADCIMFYSAIKITWQFFKLIFLIANTFHKIHLINIRFKILNFLNQSSRSQISNLTLFWKFFIEILQVLNSIFYFLLIS